MPVPTRLRATLPTLSVVLLMGLVGLTPTAAAVADPVDLPCEALPDLGRHAPADAERTCRTAENAAHRADQVPCVMGHRVERAVALADLPRPVGERAAQAAERLREAACAVERGPAGDLGAAFRQACLDVTRELRNADAPGEVQNVVQRVCEQAASMIRRLPSL